MSVDATSELHPTAAALDRALPWLEVRAGLPPVRGWTRCDTALADERFLTGWRERTAAVLTAERSCVPAPVTPATYVMQWYLSVPAYVGGLAYSLARRVPDLSPGALAFHRVDGFRHSDAVALLGDRFTCLPGDPDASSPRARVVPDETALAAVLRSELVAHAEAFFAAYRPGVRTSSRQRWGMVTDLLDGALWVGGESRAQRQAGLDDAEAVLGVPHAPLIGPTGHYRLTDALGREHLLLDRRSCCFFYKVADGPGCLACPRTGHEERVRRATGLPAPL